MNATPNNCICLALLVVFAGCATASRVYGSELDRTPLTMKIDPQDICRPVEKMAESLIAGPSVLDAILTRYRQ